MGSNEKKYKIQSSLSMDYGDNTVSLDIFYIIILITIKFINVEIINIPKSCKITINIVKLSLST